MMMNKVVGAIIFLYLVLVASAASAGEWSKTFGEESLPQELFDVSVVVAVEGPQSDRVGRILVKSLDESGDGMARINPTLDRMGGRSDEEVVAELAYVPADVIIAIRTFSEEYLTADDVEKLKAVGAEEEVAVSEEKYIPLEANLDPDLGRMAVYAIDGTLLAKVVLRPGRMLKEEERQVIGEEVKARVIEAPEPLSDAEALHVEREDFEEERAVKEDSDGEETTREPRYEERYVLEEREDSLILRDRWRDSVRRDAGMYVTLDKEWLRGFQSNRTSYRRRITLGVLTMAAGGIAAGVGAHRWVEGHYQQIPRWQRDICHRETVLERRQECVDAVHHDLYGTQIRSGQATVAAGAVVAGVGVVAFRRARGMSLHPVSTEKIIERVEELNDDEDWEEFRRQKMEKQQREEELRRREKKEQRLRDEGGLHVHRKGGRRPVQASSHGGGSVAVHPYFEFVDGVSGGMAVRWKW